MLSKILIASVAVVNATADDAEVFVPMTVKHEFDPECTEVLGYVKNCEEGLSNLMGYLKDETDAFTKSRDANIVKYG